MSIEPGVRPDDAAPDAEPSTSPDTTPPQAPDRIPPRPSTGAALRALVLRLHFYAGILIAPFIAVAAATGLLYAFSPTLEQVAYRDVLTVEAGGDPLPLQEQIDAAAEAYPEGTLDAVRPGAEPDRSTGVLFTKPDDEDKRMSVFVDPYTAEVLGRYDSYGSSASLPLRTWLAELHKDLHLGEPGRMYSELAASWMWVIAAGGIVLWFTRGRRNRRVRRLLLPEGAGARGRRRSLSWHGAVGTWALIGLLALSATGLSWSNLAGGNIGSMREAFGWQTPSLEAASGGHEGHGGSGDGHGGDGGHEHAPLSGAGPETALASARAAGLDGPVEIAVPGAERAVYTVAETSREWPADQDQVAVDPADGRVLEELRFEDYPLMAKVTKWGIAAHMGLLFGLANQVALAALALAALTLIVLGYRMWWQRRPTRAASRASFGRPVPRGALARLDWTARILVALVAVAVGVFLPLFGISLLAFLAVDTALGLKQRARAKREEQREGDGLPLGA
ncbi:PepSY domain-containing protein [Nocardiopsis sp. RSe5-2]|uniref:PepSY domain-containing protein n=1 Tax=Nocardiopsis endophytica TaxID=3018445 RepID=A0ABT4U249_9ACTN|nr:PepSY domain-containing protein [Nocardiopsis endophytica]MDA2811031.1 PepSY domain-containing protein [Nocardiopsis endophytica]